MIDGRAVDQGARIGVVAADADYRVAAAELPAGPVREALVALTDFVLARTG